jgi:hypothetical protein
MLSATHTGNGKWTMAGGAGYYIGGYAFGERTRGRLVLEGGRYEYDGE